MIDTTLLEKTALTPGFIPLPDFNVFHRYAASFPWRSHWVICRVSRCNTWRWMRHGSSP